MISLHCLVTIKYVTFTCIALGIEREFMSKGGSLFSSQIIDRKSDKGQEKEKSVE